MKNKNLISKLFTRRLFATNRRTMPIFASLMLVAGVFVGCGVLGTEGAVDENPTKLESSSEATVEPADADTISVVTTIFPEYDWVREISNGVSNVEITMLLDNGVDLHSYQPTAEDIMKIATSDVFIYVGGESDEWVEDALKEATNEDMQVVNLLEALGSDVKEEEVVEGMEAEEEEEEGEGEEEEGPEYDEHVWLSLSNAQTLVDTIAEAMGKADSANASTYQANAKSYNEKLNALDLEYQDVIKNAAGDTLLFGDRFPFRYMVDDYNLDYYAAFVGCSAETEASFETITFLAGKMDELNLGSILTIENSDQKIAKTIVDNTKSKDAKILSMDSMQSTTSDDVANGVTYFSIMESNKAVLEEALN